MRKVAILAGLLASSCGSSSAAPAHVLDHVDTMKGEAQSNGAPFPITQTTVVTVTASAACDVRLALTSDDGRKDLMEVGQSGTAPSTQQFSLTPGNWTLGYASLADQTPQFQNLTCTDIGFKADVTAP